MFDNVNVYNLDNAISVCKNNMQGGKAKAALGGISSSNVWQANAKSVLVDALDDLVNDKYQKLLTELDNCSTMSSLISTYKDLENENESLRNRINSLQGQLYYDREILDADGNTITERVKDEYVESQIEDLEYQIGNNRDRMNEIKSDVANIAG